MTGTEPTARLPAGNAGAGWLAPALIAAIAALAVISRLVPAWFGDAPLLNDTFYYTVTARNFVATGIYTFDGINPTNGFHPLWMQLLVLTFRLIGQDAGLDLQVFAIEALDSMLFLAAVLAATAFWREAVRKTSPDASGSSCSSWSSSGPWRITISPTGWSRPSCSCLSPSRPGSF